MAFGIPVENSRRCAEKSKDTLWRPLIWSVEPKAVFYPI